MNGQTLQALRGFLFFSVPEAARLIGQVQERSWRYWESNTFQIPEDITKRMLALVAFRQGLLDMINVQIDMIKAEHGEPESVRLTYYATLEDWMTQQDADPISWRPHCSAMAEVASNGAILIRFDAVEYQAWLNGRKDDQSLRGQWAAEQK